MYSFVFLWSPLLIAGVAAVGIKDEIPFGLVFACFMVCIMLGSSLFSIAMARGVSSHACLRAALVLSAVRTKTKKKPSSFFSFFLFAQASLSSPLWTSDWRLLFASFLLFEIACGVYFPAAGTLRGKVIPERSRSAVMNLFRLPLNGLVSRTKRMSHVSCGSLGKTKKKGGCCAAQH